VLSTIARMLIFVTFWRSSPHPRSRPTSPAVGPDTPSFRNASATESPSQGSRLDVMSSPIVFSGFEIIPPRIGGLDELFAFSLFKPQMPLHNLLFSCRRCDPAALRTSAKTFRKWVRRRTMLSPLVGSHNQFFLDL
jgi:hypothetical protein